MSDADDKPQLPYIDPQAAAGRRRQPGPAADDEESGEEPVKLGWSDIFAMIIAAYQVLLPMVLVIIGAMLVVYLLFVLLFH